MKFVFLLCMTIVTVWAEYVPSIEYRWWDLKDFEEKLKCTAFSEMKNALLSIKTAHSPNSGKLIVISEPGNGQDIYVAMVNPKGTWTYMKMQDKNWVESDKHDMNEYFSSKQGINLQYCAEWPEDKKAQIKLLFEVPQSKVMSIEDGKDYIVKIEQDNFIIMSRKEGLLMKDDEKTKEAETQKNTFINSVKTKISELDPKIGDTEQEAIAKKIAIYSQCRVIATSGKSNILIINMFVGTDAS